jgi:hypothetical protein
MAIPNAERQRQYRERALRDPDGLLLTLSASDAVTKGKRRIEKDMQRHRQKPT